MSGSWLAVSAQIANGLATASETNQVFASPTDGPGLPSFRRLVSSDLPEVPSGGSELTAHAQSVLVVTTDPLDLDQFQIGVGRYIVDFINTASALVLAGNIPGSSIVDRSVSFTTPHGLVVGDSFKCVGPVDKGVAPTEVFRVLEVTSDTVVLAKRNASGRTIAGGSSAFATGTATIYLSNNPGSIIPFGSIPLGISGDAIPSQQELRYTFASMINTPIAGLSTENLKAIDLGNTFNKLLVTAVDAGDSANSIALVSISSGNGWSAATLIGGRDITSGKWTSGTYTVTGNDVFAPGPGVVIIPLDFDPAVVIVRVLAQFSNLVKAWDGPTTIVPASDPLPAYVRFENGNLTDFGSGDVFHYFISE